MGKYRTSIFEKSRYNFSPACLYLEKTQLDQVPRISTGCLGTFACGRRIPLVTSCLLPSNGIAQNKPYSGASLWAGCGRRRDRHQAHNNSLRRWLGCWDLKCRQREKRWQEMLWKSRIQHHCLGWVDRWRPRNWAAPSLWGFSEGTDQPAAGFPKEPRCSCRQSAGSQS